MRNNQLNKLGKFGSGALLHRIRMSMGAGSRGLLLAQHVTIRSNRGKAWDWRQLWLVYRGKPVV